MRHDGVLDFAQMNSEHDKSVREEGGHDYLYERIASRVRQQIVEGVFAPSSRLPSLDVLATLHGVNRLTVRKAIVQLREEGLVHSIPAQGTYVSARHESGDAGSSAEALRLPVIGLLSHVLNPAGYGLYHQAIISGVYDELDKCGANLLVMAAGMVKPADFPGMVRQARTQGMIYMGPFDDAILEQMVRQGPPSVVVDHRVRGLDCDSICIDNTAGAADAMRYLLSKGCGEHVGVISGMPNDVSTSERTDGVRIALQEAGIPFEKIRMVPGNYIREGGESAMLALIQSGPVPQAIFCMNDEMAVGAMKVLQYSGFSVPGDVAVMGFDDTIWAESTNPQLTSVHVDTRRMGQMAMRLLWNRMHEKSATPVVTVIQPRVVVRGST